jgi:hypothetical protein
MRPETCPSCRKPVDECCVGDGCVNGCNDERYSREGCECDRRGLSENAECVYPDPCPRSAVSRTSSAAKVYIVGMEPLDDGPEGGPMPDECFSTREAAVAWGRERGAPLVGTSHWWGTVESVDHTYAIWEMEVRDV